MAEQGKSEKYAYLDQLSTERLEALLRADIESPDNTNDEVIFHILEVMEKRELEHPTGRLVNVGEAWAEFQQYYNIPEGEGLSLYPIKDEETPDNKADKQAQGGKVVRLHPKLKQMAIVAAVIIGIFGMMITAQAAGIDVFGAIGRWTEETFHFVSSPSGAIQSGTGAIKPGAENASEYHLIQAALDECGITEVLAPTWYPEGFEASEPEIISTSLSDTINVPFLGEEEQFYSIDITLYLSTSQLATHTFEKDSATVEQYTSGAKTFYILSNVDTVTAIWSEGLLIEKISGNISVDQVKAMIDSIGRVIK